MILTDYYRFDKLPGQSSKMRMDCTASTQSHGSFEALRNKQGALFVYVGDNTYTEAGERGKSDLAINRGVHITSLCTTNPSEPYWYGDFHGTPDVLLMVHRGFDRYQNGRVAEGSIIEIFVARGYRASRLNLFEEFTDGAFNDEMDSLRARAINEKPNCQ